MTKKKLGLYGTLTVTAALMAASALMAILWPSLPARAQGINTIVVTSTADTGGNTCGSSCTLRQAINAANNSGALLTKINFDLGSSESTIELSSQLPAVNSSVIIQGGGITVSGGGSARVFQVVRGGGLNLIGLTLIDGDAGASGSGGGVLNAGSLDVNNSTFSGNSAGESGGAIYSGGQRNALLSVNSSTFSGNSAGESGGAIYNGDGRGIGASVINSTFSGNRAGAGGGIYNSGSSPLGVNYSTFSENIASSSVDGLGSAVFNEGPAGTTLSSTILAGGPSGGNCGGGGITDGAFNISDDPTCFFTAQGSRNSTDPLLDPGGLKNNGGPTQTIALVSGGPAVDTIPPATNGCSTDVKDDQRGVDRPQGPRCDVGAFELASQQGSEQCTRTGGQGRDVMLGTRRDDVLCGRGGDDVLVGLGGDDTLRGGRGGDVFIGSGGSDTLTGGGGRDVLLGTDGVRRNDALNGGAGDDLCQADKGDERKGCERGSAGPR
jgi:CSLREA domain-containing protein